MYSALTTPTGLIYWRVLIFSQISPFFELETAKYGNLPNLTDAGRPITFYGKYHALKSIAPTTLHTISRPAA